MKIKGNITINDCKYVPTLKSSLFSITKAIAKGWKLGNNGVHITLEKDGGKIVFDTVDTTTYGYIITATMVPIPINHHQSKMKGNKTSTASIICSTARPPRPPREMEPTFLVSLSLEAPMSCRMVYLKTTIGVS
jgi:hypothetical protein